MILRLNYLTRMNGRNYLRHLAPNILFLLPNIMMGLLYGPIKRLIKPGDLNGMLWI